MTKQDTTSSGLTIVTSTKHTPSRCPRPNTSEAIITARNTAWELVESRIDEFELKNNFDVQYDHDDIMTLKKGIENILGGQWNALTPGKGVTMLLGKVQNLLTKIKETDIIDTDSY